LRLAHEFLRETRTEIERASADGADLPPRIRTVHDRPGHSSPEFRTLMLPIPDSAGGSSPTVLSRSIARFAESRKPSCLLLALEVVTPDESGDSRPLLIAEARDQKGTRMFLMQPFDRVDGRIRWHEPIEGGWRDPGEEEMILDAAFAR
jgi:hypothetical protein